MPNNKNHDDELDELMTFLADSVSEMSESQIKEEFETEVRCRTKEIFRLELNALHKRKLQKARAEYELVSRELPLRSHSLPPSAKDRRVLLFRIFSRQPELGQLALTAQHRELVDLSDSDVESFLAQLAELGLLARFLEDK